MARNTLKQLHPYLYKRVRLKAIVNMLLGLSLIFSKHVNTASIDKTDLGHYLPYTVWGSIFVVIGFGITYGLLAKPGVFRTVRVWLYISFVYATFWLIALAATVVFKTSVTAVLLVLWSYYVYNLRLIANDPAWGGAEIIRGVKDGRQ